MARRRARRDTYPYVLKDKNKIVYIGITDDPKRREQEHRVERKRFTRIVVGYPCSKETALEREQSRIRQYQGSHGGKKPRYND